jgi:dihydroxyacetone kinase
MTYAVVGYKTHVEEQGLGLRVVGPFYQTDRANRAKSILGAANADMSFEVISLADGVATVMGAKKVIRENKRKEKASM